jgi:hypothetical protein
VNVPVFERGRSILRRKNTSFWVDELARPADDPHRSRSDPPRFADDRCRHADDPSRLVDDHDRPRDDPHRQRGRRVWSGRRPIPLARRHGSLGGRPVSLAKRRSSSGKRHPSPGGPPPSSAKRHRSLGGRPMSSHETTWVVGVTMPLVQARDAAFASRTASLPSRSALLQRITVIPRRNGPRHLGRIRSLGRRGGIVRRRGVRYRWKGVVVRPEPLGLLRRGLALLLHQGCGVSE